MRTTARFEFPAAQEAVFRRARRIEWLTLAYVASAALALFLTMGGSQAMRTSFFEDVFSLVPPLAFLVGTAIARRAPNPRYPYGYHRATSIGFLAAATALLAMGAFLLTEAGLKLARAERTTIGVMQVGGVVFWAGWPMLAALAYSSIPAVLLGRVKARLAPRIHDKVLRAQADMMQADWMAESATAIGVLGVGLGYWWVDPLAAGLVSLGILKDGLVNLATAASDLIDRVPVRTDRAGVEPAAQKLERWLLEQPWIAAAEVRLREEGHVFFGEAYVVPTDDAGELPRRVRETMERIKDLDWRLHDVTIGVVDRQGHRS